jgi:hypothetical protein
MLDKQALASALESAFRSAEPGEDSVAQVCSAMATAIDNYVKSGKVVVDSTAGGCNYAGAHPPLHSEGAIT